MGIVTDEMRLLAEEQRLALVAPDGTPISSAKGTIAVWDARTIFSFDLKKPAAVGLLRSNGKTNRVLSGAS
jgi:hypothetical protein